MILDIIAQTDFAGAIEQTYHCPGAAKVAGLIHQVRRGNPQGTLVLDAGDVLCAAPIVNLTDGTDVIRVLNSLGVDAMTLGNHEFDNGPQAMERALSVAEFPILCANIRRADTGELAGKPYVLLERMGITIGVVGVTTEYTPYMLRTDRFDGYIMESPSQALQTYIPEVRKKADVVVVLSHLPGTLTEKGEEQGELYQVMNNTPEADVFIGGHNFGSLAQIRGKTVVAKAGFSAGKIARITLTLDDNRNITHRRVKIYDMMEYPAEPDQMVQHQVDAVMEPFRPMLNEPLASLSVRLDVDSLRECALGNFYTDGLRKAAGARVGLFNATSIFGFIPAGPVTAEMLRHVMCFDEAIFCGTMTGDQLRQLFERTYETGHWRNNRALHFSGLRVVVDTRRPEGTRVVSITDEAGVPLAPQDAVTVATTDYIASGGNDYREIMGSVCWEDTGVMTHSFYTGFLRCQGVLPHETDGRLQNLDPDWHNPMISNSPCYREVSL